MKILPYTLASLLAAGSWLPAGAAAKHALGFNRDVRPILSDRCFACHGPDSNKRGAGLRLDQREGAVAELPDGERGRFAIVPGNPEASELIRRIHHTDPDVVMPPPESHLSLSAEEKDVLARWVREGAVYEKHWAFVRPEKEPLPEVSDPSWARQPIDSFVLRRLEDAKIEPAEEADRRTLLRRVHLDLTGLPPTLEDIDTFLSDNRPGAYDRVVDRLLASPHFGERMALPWLDAARYADTHGYQADFSRTMWPYRDQVIRAFNANQRFDAFTVEQLAGDLLPDPTDAQLVASGFNRNHRINSEAGIIAEEYRTEYVVDRTETTATVWMGLTYNCARCHDHKYDALEQEDYYSLYAYFNNVPEKGRDGKREIAPPSHRFRSPDWEAQLRALVYAQEREFAAYNRLLGAEVSPPVPVLSWTAVGDLLTRPPEQWHPVETMALRHALEPALSARRDELEAAEAAVVAHQGAYLETMVMRELTQPRPTFVLQRGAYDTPDKTRRVLPRPPSVIDVSYAGLPPNRLGLARWLVHPDHPLTARVTVNRFWQEFFGTGLVATPEDFGVQGAWPSHPGLLDWLARDFVDNGWDVKRLVRQVVTSATYRQAAITTPAKVEADPFNRLLSRAPRVRLRAHLLRDQALAASGLLVRRIGGPSVKPYQPPGLWKEVSFNKGYPTDEYQPDTGDSLYRRGLYTFWKRTLNPPGPASFDAASREYCVVSLPRTNTPLQALNLLNDPTYLEAARKLAERMLLEGGGSDAERLAYGHEVLLSTRITPSARQRLQAGLDDYRVALAGFPESVQALLDAGDSPVNERLDRTQLAAYSIVASILINLDAAVHRP